jgi:hypothetical protein
MKLSVAIPFGHLLTEHHQASSFCGCAISDGLRGAKKPEQLPSARWMDLLGYSRDDSNAWYSAALEEWPWLNNHYRVPTNLKVRTIVCSQCWDPRNELLHAFAIDIISDYFFMIENREIPLETLLDWIRANEPSEEDSGANGQLTAVVVNHQESCARNGDLTEVLAST